MFKKLTFLLIFLAFSLFLGKGLATESSGDATNLPLGPQRIQIPLDPTKINISVPPTLLQRPNQTPAGETATNTTGTNEPTPEKPAEPSDNSSSKPKPDEGQGGGGTSLEDIQKEIALQKLEKLLNDDEDDETKEAESQCKERYNAFDTDFKAFGDACSDFKRRGGMSCEAVLRGCAKCSSASEGDEKVDCPKVYQNSYCPSLRGQALKLWKEDYEKSEEALKDLVEGIKEDEEKLKEAQSKIMEKLADLDASYKKTTQTFQTEFQKIESNLIAQRDRNKEAKVAPLLAQVKEINDQISLTPRFNFNLGIQREQAILDYKGELVKLDKSCRIEAQVKVDAERQKRAAELNSGARYVTLNMALNKNRKSFAQIDTTSYRKHFHFCINEPRKLLQETRDSKLRAIENERRLHAKELEILVYKLNRQNRDVKRAEGEIGNKFRTELNKIYEIKVAQEQSAKQEYQQAQAQIMQELNLLGVEEAKLRQRIHFELPNNDFILGQQRMAINNAQRAGISPEDSDDTRDKESTFNKAQTALDNKNSSWYAANNACCGTENEITQNNKNNCK